eukprot:scaffold11.g3978.t1
MFYAADLLGKKSPLGAIWIAAHQPRKLNRQRLMSINVSETCNQIMAPEVPQALRLQAILVGVVVVVFNKQSLILLEDAQEMLHRLRAMSTEEAAKVTLEEGKRQARTEAITLGMADLEAAGPLDDLFPAFPVPLGADLLLPAPGGAAARDDLFVVPTLGEGEEEGGAPSAGTRGGRGGRGASAGAVQQGRGRGGRGGLVLEGADVELHLEELHRHDLHLMDHQETFDVPPDFALPAPEADGGLGAGAGLMEAPLPDELFPMPSVLGGDAEAAAAAEAGEAVEQPAPLRSATPPTSSERREGSGGGAPRTQRRRRSKKRGQATVDKLEDILIPGSTYRQWQQDTSDLRAARTAHLPPAAPPVGAAALEMGPVSASLLPGGAWPPELAALYRRIAATPVKPKRKARRGAEDEAEEDAEERLTGAAGVAHELQPADDFLLPPADELPLLEDAAADLALGLEPYAGFGGLGAGGEEEHPFRRRAACAGEGEGEEEEEELDVETERLRAALLNPTDPDFFMRATPGSLSLGGPPGSRRGRSGGALRRDSEGGLASGGTASDRHRGRLSGLEEEEGGAAGDHDLAGMLPVVGEDEAYLEQELEEAGGPAGGTRDAKRRRLAGPGADEGSGGPGGGTGTGTGAGTYGTLSQFELLEESNRQTQGEAQPPAVGRHAHALIGVLRGRFHAAESQAGDAEAEAELSLFRLCERLTRRESAKLFSQFLVLASNDFVRASQAEPYGDITLRRGPFL